MAAKNWFTGKIMLMALAMSISPGARGAEPLKAMSFNVRYGTADDGPNRWELRRDFLLETIRRFDPDLLGTQEVLAEQADFLQGALAGHLFVGVGRDDGRRQGEFSAIFIRKERFELVDSGHFWLSQTPLVPGSKSWDSSLPRMATWARLRDRAAEGKPLLFLNTHWDHQGEQARLESAKLIKTWLRQHAAGATIILAGDFNATEEDEPYRVLASRDDPPLLDSYRLLHRQVRPDEATFHDFTGAVQGSRIDWILHSADLRPRAATIERAHREDRYPSDHFPVAAVLERVKADR